MRLPCECRDYRNSASNLLDLADWIRTPARTALQSIRLVGSKQFARIQSLAAVAKKGSNARPGRGEEAPPIALDLQASSIPAPIDMLLPDAKHCRAHARKLGTSL